MRKFIAITAVALASFVLNMAEAEARGPIRNVGVGVARAGAGVARVGVTRVGVGAARMGTRVGVGAARVGVGAARVVTPGPFIGPVRPRIGVPVVGATLAAPAVIVAPPVVYSQSYYYSY